MDREIPERFFYHSFPRRGRSTAVEIDKGCKILSLMCDGLLLTPETIKWEYPHADGSQPREQTVLQKRVCFTELTPVELPRHAQEFGHFSLEFSVDVLKGLGALPVFYIPMASEKTGEVATLGSTLVLQIIDAMNLAQRISDVKPILDGGQVAAQIECTFGFEKRKTFNLNTSQAAQTLEAFTYALTPPKMMEQALNGLLQYFYPADDIPRNKALAYYRQREWRIGGNFSIRGEEVMRLPSSELIDKLVEIDKEFFERTLPWSGKRLAEETYMFPGIGEKRIIEMANRIIVPSDAIKKVKIAIKDLENPPPIVALETCHEFCKESALI